MCHRDESQRDSTVYPWAARRLARHVGRKNLGRLVVRLGETTRDEIGGVRSAKECLHERRQQERQDRRAPVGRAAAPESSQPRLSRRTRPTKPEGTGAQLSDHHERSRTGHVAGEGDLSKLGDCLYRQAGLCTAPAWRVAREEQRTGSAQACRAVLLTTRCTESVTQASEGA